MTLIPVTQTLIALTVAVAIVYDIYAMSKEGFKATISWQIYSKSQKYPIIPFAFGVLMGHLFWTQIC